MNFIGAFIGTLAAASFIAFGLLGCKQVEACKSCDCGCVCCKDCCCECDGKCCDKCKCKCSCANENCTCDANCDCKEGCKCEKCFK
jgi:hypothetical protein